MALVFLCGALRVALVTAFFVIALTDKALATDLMVPFALLVLAIAVYDARDNCRRSR